MNKYEDLQKKTEGFLLLFNQQFIFSICQMWHYKREEIEYRRETHMSRFVGPTIEVESAQGVREVSLDTRQIGRAHV